MLHRTPHTVIYTSLTSDRVPSRNLAGSMRSQDNIEKVGHRKERIKEDDEEYNLLFRERLTVISIHR